MYYDVVIIGAGIVGCATARYLSRYQVKILVIEQGADVAVGATKANSGILHSGYDCQPGTLKAALNVEGLNMYPRLAQELDIPYRMNGSMVIATDEASDKPLKQLMERGLQNGVSGLEILSGEAAREIEPNLNPTITCALLAKNAGIVSPYEAAIAFAENAATNGADFALETTVTGITPAILRDRLNFDDLGKSDPGYTVQTSKGCYHAQIIINAAGIDSGNIHNMTNADKEAILPQRGEYYLLDNTQRDLVGHTIFQLPTHLGKGVLIAPTVDYNILLGPTADSIEENSNDTSTTSQGLAETLEKASLSLKHIPIRDRITAFAGIRAKHNRKDFILEEPRPGFINAMGIDSPGLTAAPAIAKAVAEMALAHLQPKENPGFTPNRMGIKRFRELSPTLQAEYIAENSAYGRIVCRCETITEAEITEAIHRPIGAKNLDALKRRTRAQMGRCQGGFCTIRLMELLSRELRLPETDIVKDSTGSGLVLPLGYAAETHGNQHV